MCAFVPVAPVSTNKFTREEYESVSVPTLIVVGEKDTGLGRTSAKHLSQIPSASLIQVGGSQNFELPKSGSMSGNPRFLARLRPIQIFGISEPDTEPN